MAKQGWRWSCRHRYQTSDRHSGTSSCSVASAASSNRGGGGSGAKGASGAIDASPVMTNRLFTIVHVDVGTYGAKVNMLVIGIFAIAVMIAKSL